MSDKNLKARTRFKDYRRKLNIVHREAREIANKTRKGYSIRFPKSRKFMIGRISNLTAVYVPDFKNIKTHIEEKEIPQIPSVFIPPEERLGFKIRLKWWQKIFKTIKEPLKRL